MNDTSTFKIQRDRQKASPSLVKNMRRQEGLCAGGVLYSFSPQSRQ